RATGATPVVIAPPRSTYRLLHRLPTTSSHPIRPPHEPSRTLLKPPEPAERATVLIRLLREFLRPYRVPMALIVLFQLSQTIAILYLPPLNADVIDNGVVKGDIGYILQVGGVMLAVSLVQICCAIGAVYFGARTSMAFGRDVRSSIFNRVQSFSAREVGRF